MSDEVGNTTGPPGGDDGAAAPAVDRAAVERLLNLLDLLPWPFLEGTYEREFWEGIGAVLGWADPRYPAEKIAFSVDQVETQMGTEAINAEDARKLAKYCLMFFDHDDRPQLWAIVGKAVDAGADLATGRRWADAVCRAAWDVFVPLEAAERRQRQPLLRRAGAMWLLYPDGRPATSGE